MAEYIEKAKRLRYIRTLLIQYLNDGGKFQVSKRGPIKFEEQYPDILLDLIHDPQTKLSVGDQVRVHAVLEAPWYSDPDESDTSHGQYTVVAFVRLHARIKQSTATGLFCVLRKEMDGAGSNPHLFLRTGKNSEAVALFFVGALEKIA